MAVSEASFKESRLEVAGATIQMRTAGEGRPLLLLHGELGFPGWMRYHETLATSRKVYAPSHPGYDESNGIEWMMQVRDLAGWYLEALDDMGLDEIDLIGFSFGGWLAAEMAVMCPQQFQKLVLVDAAGVKPPTGEIYDIFQVVAKSYIASSVLDPAKTPEFQEICPDEPTPEQAEVWESSREGACRLSWRPYMHYPALPNLLPRLKRLPTQIIWGRQDPIVPLSSGQLYRDSIPGSQLTVIENCGHRPEVEKPDEFISAVQGFLKD